MLPTNKNMKNILVMLGHSVKKGIISGGGLSKPKNGQKMVHFDFFRKMSGGYVPNFFFQRLDKFFGDFCY